MTSEVMGMGNYIYTIGRELGSGGYTVAKLLAERLGIKYALASNPDCLSIFVHADMDDRIKRVSKREDVTESKAKDMIQKRDKQRSSYYNYYTCKKWGDSRSYDLTLNTSKITPEACVDIILDFRKKMEQKK